MLFTIEIGIGSPSMPECCIEAMIPTCLRQKFYREFTIDFRQMMYCHPRFSQRKTRFLTMKTLYLKIAICYRALCGAAVAAIVFESTVFASASALTDASSAYNQGHIDSAQNQIFSALKSDPETYLKPEFVLLLSATYLANNEPEQAQAVLDALRGQYPVYATDSNAVRIQAGFFERRGELEKAQALLGKTPTGESLYHLAILLDHSGQTFAAVTRLKELLDSKPAASLMARAQLALASAYLRLNESTSADQVLSSLDGTTDASIKPYATFLKAASAFAAGQVVPARSQLAQLPDSPPTLKAFGSTLGGASLLAAADVAGAIDLFNAGLSTGTGEKSLSRGRWIIGRLSSAR